MEGMQNKCPPSAETRNISKRCRQTNKGLFLLADQRLHRHDVGYLITPERVYPSSDICRKLIGGSCSGSRRVAVLRKNIV